MSPEFSKYADGLVPVIVQDANSRTILMLGFMNEEALAQTIREGKITFYSRSKQRLWTKGESSGHYLQLKEILIDCDNDTLLIKAVPAGPVCHTGADTCFGEINTGFSLQKLEGVIADRKANPTAASYTASLFEKGLNKIAQKVGEEAVELVIESKDNDDSRFLNEAADLLYHYLILLQQKNFRLSDVEQVLSAREK
jgi:phosphoribosyl-AMP cyclohydrolase / phosphoribosyl-ATP pyrophosphohydrolase